MTWGHVSLESVCIFQEEDKEGESRVITRDTCATSVRTTLPYHWEKEPKLSVTPDSRFQALGTGTRPATMVQRKLTFAPPASSSSFSFFFLFLFCHSHGSLKFCCCCCLSLSTATSKSGGGSVPAAAAASSCLLLGYVSAIRLVPCFRDLQLLPFRFAQRNLCCMSRATMKHQQNSEPPPDFVMVIWKWHVS